MVGRGRADLLVIVTAQIARCEELCAMQRALIARHRASGLVTEGLEAILVEFELTLTRMRLREARLQA